jgi:hypothetical protein
VKVASAAAPPAAEIALRTFAVTTGVVASADDSG